MIVWNPFKPMGGHTAEAIRESPGHCPMAGALFSAYPLLHPADSDTARQRYPDITVIVHPECTLETVQAADMHGSTEVIRKVINEAALPAASGPWALR